MGFPPWLSRKQSEYHIIVWYDMMMVKAMFKFWSGNSGKSEKKYLPHGPPPKTPMMTWFYKNGHISANNGPIWQIRNLASSGEQPTSADFDNGVARDSVTRARDVIDPDLYWVCPITRRHHSNELHGLQTVTRLVFDIHGRGWLSQKLLSRFRSFFAR